MCLEKGCKLWISTAKRTLGKFEHRIFIVEKYNFGGECRLWFGTLFQLNREGLVRAFSPYHQGPNIGPISNSKYPPFFLISKTNSKSEA